MTSAVDPNAPHSSTDVLVVGAGPVGLTLALQLRRRGIDTMVVDRRTERAPFAKAVGVSPRTLEIFDSLDMIRPALNASATMRGQFVFAGGSELRLDFPLPVEIPYRFVSMPQYETERILADALTAAGGTVVRGVEFTGFDDRADSVTSTLHSARGPSTVSSRYLVGCDGAHSSIRRAAGIDFEGDAFPEEYMLADVEVDWTVPAGYGVRAMHLGDDGKVDDLLVAIPLPGRRRYRISMFTPPELTTTANTGEVAHGLEGGRAPELHHVQAVLDRLAPEPTTASALRWSSVFRISHRLAGRYSRGRVYLAGDAAHIHPPTGAQGMNTGIQDATNLGWKLALATQGRAAEDLLDSYHRERHPVGEEVVGRTVRHAREGLGAGENDPATAILREAQLLVGYPDSPLVGADGPIEVGPGPGERAPDAGGLTQDATAVPTRVHELLRHTGHTLLLWADTAADVAAQLTVAAAVTDRFGTDVRVHVVVADAAEVPDVSGIVLRDNDGRFAVTYGATGRAGCLIRPDGYVGYRTDAASTARVEAALARVLRHP